MHFFSFRPVSLTTSGVFLNIRTWLYARKLYCPSSSFVWGMSQWTNTFGCFPTRNPGWPVRWRHLCRTETPPTKGNQESQVWLQEKHRKSSIWQQLKCGRVSSRSPISGGRPTQGLDSSIALAEELNTPFAHFDIPTLHSVAQCFSIPVLMTHCPACFRGFPRPPHLIQMVSSSSSSAVAW